MIVASHVFIGDENIKGKYYFLCSTTSDSIDYFTQIKKMNK